MINKPLRIVQLLQVHSLSLGLTSHQRVFSMEQKLLLLFLWSIQPFRTSCSNSIHSLSWIVLEATSLFKILLFHVLVHVALSLKMLILRYSSQIWMESNYNSRTQLRSTITETINIQFKCRQKTMLRKINHRFWAIHIYATSPLIAFKLE